MNVVLKQVILAIIIVSAAEQEDSVLYLDTVMACPWSKVARANRLYFPPLSNPKVEKVFICEACRVHRHWD
jgi:hypothetical protein